VRHDPLPVNDRSEPRPEIEEEDEDDGGCPPVEHAGDETVDEAPNGHRHCS
jgi:hypothetical protein